MSSADPPVVSIITPAHNSERFLSETIRSVLAQTFSNWEMIIVDDVSTDSTPDLARGFAEEDSRIRVVRLPSSAGAGGARNAGKRHLLSHRRRRRKRSCRGGLRPELHGRRAHRYPRRQTMKVPTAQSERLLRFVSIHG